MYHRSVPTDAKVLSAGTASPASRMATGVEAPREPSFEAQRALIAGIPQDLRKQKLHSWNVHTSSHAYQDPGGKKQ